MSLPGQPMVAMDADAVAAEFVRRIPIHFARRHNLIGLRTDDPAVLAIATDDAGRQPTIDNLALTLGTEVRMVVADSATIRQLINAGYEQQRFDVADVAEEVAAGSTAEVTVQAADGDLLDNATRAPVIKLVNLLLFEAAKRRASDVHIHPQDGELVIRLRIDGILFDYLRPGKHLQEEIVSRIKIMGGIDIAEKRLPQDGRTTVRIGERLIDLRIATLPTAHGERVVLRLLDKGARLYGLSELGMAAEVLGGLESLIHRAHGMLLMTGPTGSGKSTTLYAALQRIDYQQLNVVTLEDPIEYHLPGISQTQVSERKGMTFAAGLRSILRQDPDVIMVGEIRDEPTARLAVQSALTGHLVLSTLHTNDAAGAVARLLDLGIEPYLVADSVLGVGAQRLVRRNCTGCVQTRSIDRLEAVELGLSLEQQIQQGVGCERCGGTGYYERQGIFELLIVNETIRRLIHQRSDAAALRGAAIAEGMHSLRDDGIRLIRLGCTTPAEVRRVTRGADRNDHAAAEGV